ncbi:MAG: helix-turn-helix domain-containing protein [Butyrivibrio sp.]|nr:helix-turn-helix domain-containing protein [Butyrivibrio sp.]
MNSKRNNILADRLRVLRIGKGMKQSEFCKVFSDFCGRSEVLPISTLSSWEIGSKRPTLEIICQLADYFNVTTDFLLGREVVSPKQPDVKRQFILDDYIIEIAKDDLSHFDNKPVFLTFFDGKKLYGEWGIYNMKKDVFRCSEQSVRNSELFKFYSCAPDLYNNLKNRQQKQGC